MSTSTSTSTSTEAQSASERQSASDHPFTEHRLRSGQMLTHHDPAYGTVIVWFNREAPQGGTFHCRWSSTGDNPPHSYRDFSALCFHLGDRARSRRWRIVTDAPPPSTESLTEGALYRGLHFQGAHFGTGTLTVWYDPKRASGVGRFCAQWSDYYDGRVLEFGSFISLTCHLGDGGGIGWQAVKNGGETCADDRIA